ncbi:MAG: AAA domain-containing protein [Acidimicrobiaceae bacterium]|nr:AAA domain-containing protein [Acidimicrobiaceae bacterium]MYG56131.1 AAA domain-containing protein [Acidimicrobiaceae bacterium]MYK00179.1 AAA domain-containing protein [Acidimicrobiaceae bacterium]
MSVPNPTEQPEYWQQRLDEYLDHLRTSLKPGTVNNSWSVLHRWIDHTLARETSPEIFDRSLVEEFLDEQNNLKEGTRRSYSDDIRWWCEYQQAKVQAPQAWVVRAGSDGAEEQHNLNHGVVTIGWYDFDEFDSMSDRDELGERLQERYPDVDIRSARDQLWRFGKEISIGDLVVMPQKRPGLNPRLIAIGRVVGPYEWAPSQPENVRHRRKVEWILTDVSRDILGDDLNEQLNLPPTVYEPHKFDVPYRIQYLAEHGEDPGDRNPTVDPAPPVVDTRSLEERMEDAADKLLCDVSFLEEIVGLLKDKGQVIFYGPPGTGKTHLAQVLAETLAPEEKARSLVQFHPAYSYEDFFEGYRPVVDDGQMTYELTWGPLAKLAEHAADHPEQHVMVIDEINRANLPRVLGELLFLLEYRNKSIQVVHRPEDDFSLPKNLWFIGTMNTADRSIALIDAAMRRRFHFVPFFEREEPTKSLLRKWTQKYAPDQAWVVDLVSAVNGELEKELGGEHLQLGPSYFMKTDLNDGGFKRVWRYNIEPFIEDQLFGNPDKIARFRFDAVLRRHGRMVDEVQPSEPAEDVSSGSGRNPVSPEMRDTEFVRGLVERLGDKLRFFQTKYPLDTSVRPAERGTASR